MVKKSLVFVICFILLQSSFALSFSHQYRAHQNTKKSQIIFADLIFHNGNIITMNETNQNPSIVAVKDGKISIIDHDTNPDKINQYNGTKIDLNGQTLMPGFIDGHSHFTDTILTLFGQNIYPYPFGQCNTVQNVKDKLLAYIQKKNKQNSTDWNQNSTVWAAGFNDVDMDRMPNRLDLDNVSLTHPIYIVHFSQHLGVGNTKALIEVGYNNSSPQLVKPEGVLDVFPTNQIPSDNLILTGVARQYAILPLRQKFTPKLQNLDEDQFLNGMNSYLKSGITTGQDLLNSKDDAKYYSNKGQKLIFDLVAYYPTLTHKDIDDILVLRKQTNNNKFKVLGAKFFLDGSIQGYTAALSSPYWVPQQLYQNGTNLDNYVYDEERSCCNETCGTDTFRNRTLLKDLFKRCFDEGIDINVHCNGDLAAQRMINGIKWARKQTNNKQSPTRVVMIHSQTLTDEQLDLCVEVGIMPSFFPGHIYYWGEKHYSTFLGPDRARRMNPAGSALRKGLRYSFHTDSPVVKIGEFSDDFNTIFTTLNAGVNRKTVKGRQLDYKSQSQKVSVYNGLKALTIHPAWQTHTDHIKGSIDLNKIADLIILDKNPLEQEIDLRTIKVQATYKNGQQIWIREDN